MARDSIRRLDWRAVIVAIVIAAFIAVCIWFVRAHLQRRAMQDVQPLVPNSTEKR